MAAIAQRTRSATPAAAVAKSVEKGITALALDPCADEKRRGALAACHALTAMDRSVDMATEAIISGAEKDTLSNLLKNYQRNMEAVYSASRDLPPFAAGYVEALAEYIEGVLTSGVPSMGLWKPRSAMTPRQLAAADRQLRELYADGN